MTRGGDVGGVCLYKDAETAYIGNSDFLRGLATCFFDDML